MIERKARIFNIQKYSIYDGPGIRTLVFFKGCPLRCRWCSNPESLERKYQIMCQHDLCMNCGQCTAVCPVGIHVMQGAQHTVNRSIDCIACGKCAEVCPKQALSVAGKDVTISEVLSVIEQDMSFYQTSGGGVTLGGGEATMQPEFAAQLLQECKRLGIHTAIETSGYTPQEAILKMAESLDLFLYDIKHIDSDTHYSLTGVRNERILENLQELIRRRYNVKVRMPLIKGLNNDAETIRRTIEFLMPYRDRKNFQGVDLLPYHKLGVNKYKQLDKEYPIQGDMSLTDEDLNLIEKQISEFDFPVKVIKH